jgi:serine/threonine-protein kinase
MPTAPRYFLDFVREQAHSCEPGVSPHPNEHRRVQGDAMSEQPHPEQTVDHSGATNPLDAGLAAAFGPDSGPVLQTLAGSPASVPRVLLREPEGEPPTPVVLPGSPELPPGGAGLDGTGRYQLVGEIARGGKGAVLKGRDTDLGRDVAVKVLLEGHAGRAELVQRFVEEAQIAGQLQHPGVTPVYELGVLPDRRPYFTMKLVKGRTLAALLAQRNDPAQDRPRWLGVFLQACQALAYARGVIHRDLKPSNVMVGAFGEVQVMDWGLAKLLAQGGVADEQKAQRAGEATTIQTPRSQGAEGGGSHTQAGSVLGTPAYMAPEQARGEVELVDERADVFGLGAILCVVLTGQPPFTGQPAEATRKSQKGDLAEAVTRLEGCGADAELVELAKRCLAAEPWQRLRHAGEVADAVAAHLAALQERLAQAQRQRDRAEVRVAEERKRRRLALGLGSAVLLLVGALALGGLHWQRQRGRAEGERAQRAERAREAVEAALDQVGGLLRQGRWAEAEALIDQAQGQLPDAAEAGLGERLGRWRFGLGLARALDKARLDRAALVDGKWYPWRRAPAYAAAFRAHGLDVRRGALAALAETIRTSGVAEQVGAALDDWALEQRGLARRLFALARLADPDAERDGFRDPALWRDRERLLRLAEQADPGRLSPPMLEALGREVKRSGGDSVGLLAAGQRRHPGDFWLCFTLANVLAHQGRRGEAVGHYAAALAVRQDSSIVHYNLGGVLHLKGQLEGAIACYQKAIAADPKHVLAHYNHGNALKDKGKLHEALACYQKALALDPKYAHAHKNLGEALLYQGQFAQARDATRRCLDLLPASDPLQGAVVKQLQQCEQMLALEKRLAAVLQGKAEPKNAAERLDLAWVAVRPAKGQYVTAARLYAEAFAEHPGLADDQRVGHRYEAACAAALAAAGKGQGAAKLDARERARLRKQALAWLHAELRRWAGRLDAGTPGDRALVQRKLRYWQQDPDLAVLRDRMPLAGLDEDEAVGCKALWSEVAALLARARKVQ